MTGLDCLKEKLMENYGLSEKQAELKVNSETAKMIVETLGKEAGLLEALVTPFVKEQEDKARSREVELDNYHYRLRDREAKLQREQKEFAEQAEQMKEEYKRLRQIRQDILLTETPEAKDRRRMYEVFKRDVEKMGQLQEESKRAYIEGLVAILTGKPPKCADLDGVE